MNDISIPPTEARVLISHGRALGRKDHVARFLEHLGLRVVVLHEQPNYGRSIIEKLEFNSDVDYAVVLLTGDDQGGLRDTPIGEQHPRPRQDVVHELGFFGGRLGRQHVCALWEEGVEIPSIYDGVVLILLDEHEGWKLRLGKELQAAGISVDLNLAA